MADPNTDITAEDGRKITTEAIKWEGTPYEEDGASSQMGTEGGADCSGSTYKIYTAAGFPYDYRNTATFVAYVTKTGKFRKLGPDEAHQDGDLLLWSSHMAIYCTFMGDSTHATTPREKAGHSFTQKNDCWSATKPGGNPYGPGRIVWLRGGVLPDYYRYQK